MTIDFIDSKQAFEEALETGILSENETAKNSMNMYEMGPNNFNKILRNNRKSLNNYKIK
mgnify:CR=1 FL=1